MFSKHARIGKPINIEGLAESTRGLGFASAIGMLKYATSSEGGMLATLSDLGSKQRKRKSGKLISWFKENF